MKWMRLPKPIQKSIKPITIAHCSNEFPRIIDARLAWMYSRIIPQAPLANIQAHNRNEAKLKVRVLLAIGCDTTWKMR